MSETTMISLKTSYNLHFSFAVRYQFLLALLSTAVHAMYCQLRSAWPIDLGTNTMAPAKGYLFLETSLPQKAG